MLEGLLWGKEPYY